MRNGLRWRLSRRKGRNADMTIRNLDALFAPKSVALIGASDRSATVGGTMVRNLLDSAFRGRVMLVNPRHTSISGVSCYPDAASLPERPDLAVIATPFAGIPRVIDDLGQSGCRAAVVISAGPGGREESGWRQSLLEAARPHLMRLLGPNCVGALVPAIGLNAGFAHMSPLAGHIAFLAQSGAIVTSVIDWAGAWSIGFSCLLSMGEMADNDFADVIDYLAGDPATSSILLYIETVGTPGNSCPLPGLRRAASRSSSSRQGAMPGPPPPSGRWRPPNRSRAAGWPF
jgi:acetyltransferase